MTNNELTTGQKTVQATTDAPTPTEADLCEALGLTREVNGYCDMPSCAIRVGCNVTGDGHPPACFAYGVENAGVNLHTPEGLGRLISALHAAKHALLIDSHSLPSEFGMIYRVAISPAVQESKITFGPDLNRVWIAAGIAALARGWLNMEASDETKT